MGLPGRGCAGWIPRTRRATGPKRWAPKAHCFEFRLLEVAESVEHHDASALRIVQRPAATSPLRGSQTQLSKR